MKEKHPMPRRSRLLEGMPRFTGFPRRPMRTGTGPSTRHPEQACRFSERVALTEEELSEIATRINAAGQADPTADVVDPLMCKMGAPSIAAMHKLLNQMAGEVAADPPARVTHRDNDRLFHDPAANVLDLGTCPWLT